MLVALFIIIPAIILALSIISRLAELGDEIEFEPDEQVLFTAYRHWTVVFFRCFIIAIAALMAFGIAFYRSIGGTFVQDSAAPSGNDLANVLLWILLGIVVTMRILLGRRASADKKRKRLPFWERALFVIVIAAIAFLITFRYDGGRIFTIDPSNITGLDGINAFFIGLGLLLLALMVYTYFDLQDDSLVLTNFRVLRREVQEVPVFGAVLSFIFRRNIVIREFLQQMVIEDVQQVNVEQKSYFEFYLYQFFRLLERVGVRGYKRYGTIVVQSLSFQVITFKEATAPKEAQQRILNRKQEATQSATPDLLLRRTLEEQVWGGKTPPPRRPARELVQQSAGLFSWMFPPNPEFRDDAKRTIVWRPAWIYILWSMSKAIIASLLVFVAAYLLNTYNIVTGLALFLVVLVATIACLFWAWWIYETWQHDLYILNDDRIIDEDKAPFGPTTRREAELRSIQNVLFKETFFESLINIGDVIVRTGGAGGSDFTFHNVPSPREVQAQINAYIVNFRRLDQEKARKENIKALTQYHLLQRQHDELLRPEVIEQIVRQSTENIARTISTRPDEEATRQVLGAARNEARAQARSELRDLVRRFLRRQSRGRT